MPSASLTGFADKINDIMPVIIKEFSRRHASEIYKGRISLPQFLILNHLSRTGENTMTDLAKFMGVTTAAMTGIMDRLVRENYAARAHDTKDRRVINMRATQKGAELARKINDQRQEMIIKVFGKLSQSDRENYLGILTRIQEIFTKEKPRATQ